jgi:hypothetical protein
MKVYLHYWMDDGSLEIDEEPIFGGAREEYPVDIPESLINKYKNAVEQVSAAKKEILDLYYSQAPRVRQIKSKKTK